MYVYVETYVCLCAGMYVCMHVQIDVRRLNTEHFTCVNRKGKRSNEIFQAMSD